MPIPKQDVTAKQITGIRQWIRALQVTLAATIADYAASYLSSESWLQELDDDIAGHESWLQELDDRVTALEGA